MIPLLTRFQTNQALYRLSGCLALLGHFDTMVNGITN
jgi:hypothetical protein